jgi:hypothetical protein
MADAEQPEGENEVLELTETVEAPEQREGTETEPEGSEDEEVIVSFGEEAAPASEGEAPEWVRDLRKRNRELERELAEARKSAGPEVPEVGPKPTYEGCDFDEERFEAELDAWKDRKAKADSAKSEAQKAQEEAQERYQAKVAAYGEQKTQLGVKDFDQAEEQVLASLSQAQQAILIHGAEDKAKLVYALGRHPEKLRQLASISDPIEFAFAAAKLEGQTKVSRRPATTPDSSPAGSGAIKPGAKLSDKSSTDAWMQSRREQVRKR